MNRLSKDTIRKIKNLVDQGHSLNEISLILLLKKTTVYYHFLKFKGRTNIPIQINDSNDELVGEFMGLFPGDGSYFHSTERGHVIRFHFNKTEDIYVKELSKKVFSYLLGNSPRIHYRENRCDVCIISKTVIKFIKEYLEWNSEKTKTYSIRLKENNYSDGFKIGFLRGSIDSDGHFTNKIAEFASVSTGLITNISNFLDSFDLQYYMLEYIDKRQNRVPIYHIRIKRCSYLDFKELINPRNTIQYKKHLKKDTNF